MDKELKNILSNLEADIKNFRIIVSKYHAELSKKGLLDKAAQIEYHSASLKIAVANLRGKKC